LSILDIAAVILFAAAVALVFFATPIEKNMGAVQKVFYFHVASAWLGMLGFGCAFVAAIVYLRTRKRLADVVEVAGVEIGLVFMLVAIVTGSIWAYPTWNTWWTWDPRLTTVTIMELAYLAYLMLRSGIEDPERRARFGAVYSIVAFISVPLTFFSIRLFNSIHPVVIGSSDPGASGSFSMTPLMLRAFLFSLLAYTVVFVSLLWHRIRLGILADRVEQMKLKQAE
jgi:heme exporter protein C